MASLETSHHSMNSKVGCLAGAADSTPYREKIRHGRPTFPELLPADDDALHLLTNGLYELCERSAPGGTELALYVHVPFCDAICSFCLFDRVPRHQSGIDWYLAALRKEILYTSSRPYARNRPVTAVYIGGGTPSCLGESELIGLVCDISEHFSLDSRVEFTVEGSARHMHRDLVIRLNSLGVNRISLGIQTFDPALRRHLSPNESHVDAGDVIQEIHDAGCANVDIDLIYGFPEQTLEMWIRDIELAIELGLESVSVFDLIIHPQTPLGKGILAGEVRGMPTTSDRIRMLQAARELFLEAGYRQQHLYHFVRPGFENRYLEARFKTQNDSLALGNTSEGRIDGFLFRNPASWEDYLARMECHCMPPMAQCLKLEGHLRVLHYIIKSLELLGVDRAECRTLFGIDPLDAFRSTFEGLMERDLVRQEGDVLQLTPLGTLWGWNVIAEFYTEVPKQA